jgi:cutinase
MVVGDPLVARVKRDLPKVNVRGYPVQVSPHPSRITNRPNIGQYPASMTGSQTGIADIPKRIAAQAAACPKEKFALVGYSQGGMVVSGALKQIAAQYQDKVVAVVLYGAGDGSSVAKAYYGKALANCAPGDFVSFPP